ncbi:MAG: hypothetical protein IPJ65_31580 [Archangiaceae bacterium]|nr:hypothetical protein [Archangiaceae bacterium]
MRSELALLVLALTGCGEGAPGPGFEPTLVTLHAQLSNPPGLEVPAGARVALVWRRADAQVGGSWLPSFGVAEELELEPRFPNRLEVAVHHRPPLDALTAGLGGQATAVGTLLVYADGNGNQRLDLEGPQASSEDRVLGLPLELTLLYAESTAYAPIARERRGFHWAKNAALDPLSGQGPDRPLELIDAGAVVELPLSGSPQLQVHLCLGLQARPPECQQGCAEVWVAEDAALSCAADGRSFTARRCMPQGSLCASACETREVLWPDGTARPRGWPCR